MPDLPITYRGVVYPWQCDHVGHMNVMWYVGKFDEATWQLFAMFGLTPSFLREKGRGMAAVQQNITVQRELLAGDVVSIDPASWRSGIFSRGNSNRCRWWSRLRRRGTVSLDEHLSADDDRAFFRNLAGGRGKIRNRPWES
jgi:hypothetical protein